MSDLSEVASALTLLEVDLAAVEKAAKEHGESDRRRFKAMDDGMSRVHAELAFIKDFLTVMQDQMVEGFRAIERRAKNGSR